VVQDEFCFTVETRKKDGYVFRLKSPTRVSPHGHMGSNPISNPATYKWVPCCYKCHLC